jgi:DNA-binding NarL/FixJ family response regulator
MDPAPARDPFGRDTPGAREPDRVPASSTDLRKLGLTDRQCDVLRLILRGLPNKLICRQLDLAEGTVKVHVSAVLRALGVRNRTQAVIAASQIGLRIS